MGVLHIRTAGSCVMHLIFYESRTVIKNKKESERNISSSRAALACMLYVINLATKQEVTLMLKAKNKTQGPCLEVLKTRQESLLIRTDQP